MIRFLRNKNERRVGSHPHWGFSLSRLGDIQSPQQKKAWIFPCAFAPWRLGVEFCLLLSAVLFLTGCESYKRTGAWAPDSVNYTLSRERNSGELTDYFGASWQLK